MRVMCITFQKALETELKEKAFETFDGYLIGEDKQVINKSLWLYTMFKTSVWQKFGRKLFEIKEALG